MTRRAFALPLLAALVAGAILRFVAAPDAPPLRVAGSPSARVADRLDHEFRAPFARSAVLFIAGLPVAAASDSGRALVRTIVAPLQAVPDVTGVLSPATSLDTLLLGDDGHSALVVIGLASSVTAARLGEIRAAVTPAGGAALGWTGEPVLANDVARLTADALRRAERVAIPATVAAAMIVFGGVGPGLAAVAGAALTVLLSLAALRILGTIVPLGGLASSVATLIAMALGLDYAIWRRGGGLGRRDVATAAVVAGCGFAALVLAPTAEIRGAAAAGLVAVAAAAIVSRWQPSATVVARGQPSRLAVAVVSHRWATLVATLVPLALLAATAFRAPLASDPLGWLPGDLPSLVTLRDLRAVGRGTAAAPILALVDLPPGAPAFSAAGWARLRAMDSTLRTVPGVADTRSVTGIGTGERTVTGGVVPEPVLASFVSVARDAALFRVFAGPDADLSTARGLADRLAQRFSDDGAVTIGGAAAMLGDFEVALRAALLPFVLLASLGSWLALAVVFRAPVVAVKAVLLNLLVAAAAVGGVVLSSPATAVRGLPATVPLVALGAAFALSIDYELLLLLQVRRAGADDHTAIALGATRASGLFLRGGALLVVVLAAFAVSGFAPLALLGRVLIAAVGLDVLLVRPVVAPALLAALGRWNWWPGTRDERR